MAAIRHYVPRFLLRNFCTGKKLKLWPYDKSTAKSFETNIQNVAGERDFYEPAAAGRGIMGTLGSGGGQFARR
jgi:hypothetical protein